MQREVINFNSGSILKKEMLDRLYRFPNEVLKCQYFEYSDGILFGLQYKEINGMHYICPGALKFNGEIYFQREPICIEDEFRNIVNEDTIYYMCFLEKPVESSNSIDNYKLQLTLQNCVDVENGFYYKKIKYQLGKFRDIVSGSGRNEEVYGLYASRDDYKFRIPSQRLQVELNEIMREKEKRKNFLDYQIIEKMNEYESVSVSFLNSYIIEYNNSLKDLDTKLLEIEITDTALEVIEKIKKAIQLYVFTYDCVVEEKTKSSGDTKKTVSGGCLLE